MSVNMHVYEWHKHAYRPDNAGGDKDICKSCKNLCAPGGIVKCIISTLQSVLYQHMRVGRIVVISGFPVFVVIHVERLGVGGQEFTFSALSHEERRKQSDGCESLDKYIDIECGAAQRDIYKRTLGGKGRRQGDHA